VDNPGSRLAAGRLEGPVSSLSDMLSRAVGKTIAIETIQGNGF
jgi:hypothetical protein